MPDDTSPATSGIHAGSGIQSVKGLTFLTARKHFIDKLGEERWEELIAPLDDEVKDLFVNAQLNLFYPEAHMRTFMHQLYYDLAGEDDEAFCAICRELALAGVSRFLRIFINLASARFVLKKVPVVWKRLRDGPAVLRAEVDDDRIRIHYEDFIFCHDHVYRLLSLSNCQALVEAATGEVPLCRILSYTNGTMCLEFLLPGSHEEAPDSWAADVFGKEQ